MSILQSNYDNKNQPLAGQRVTIIRGNTPYGNTQAEKIIGRTGTIIEHLPDSKYISVKISGLEFCRHVPMENLFKLSL